MAGWTLVAAAAGAVRRGPAGAGLWVAKRRARCSSPPRLPLPREPREPLPLGQGPAWGGGRVGRLGAGLGVGGREAAPVRGWGSGAGPAQPRQP